MSRTFEAWELQVRVALADQGVGHRTVDPLVEAAKADCEESGQGPWEAVGSPEDFAAAVAAEHPGRQESFWEAIGAMVFAVAGLSILFAIFAAIRTGSLSFPVTPAGLSGSLLLFTTLVVAHGVGPAVREQGYPRLANACWGLTGLLVLATATAFVGLPRTAFTTVPVVALIGGALLLMWLLSRGQWKDEPPEAALDTSTEEPAEDADAWFARLRSVLIGRHDLPPARADDLVAEARSHFAATAGTAPGAEFGAAATYAAHLAESEPIRQPPWWRNPSFLMVFWAADALFTLAITWRWFDQGDTVFAFLIGLPASAAIAVWAVQNWRRHRAKARRV